MEKIEAMNLWGDLEQKYAYPDPAEEYNAVGEPMFDVRLDGNALEDTTTGRFIRVWRIRIVHRMGNTLEAMKYIIERVEQRTEFSNVSIEAENNAIVIT